MYLFTVSETNDMAGAIARHVSGLTLSGLCSVLAPMAPKYCAPGCGLFILAVPEHDRDMPPEKMATIYADGGIDFTPLGSVLKDPTRLALAQEMFSPIGPEPIPGESPDPHWMND